MRPLIVDDCRSRFSILVCIEISIAVFCLFFKIVDKMDKMFEQKKKCEYFVMENVTNKKV